DERSKERIDDRREERIDGRRGKRIDGRRAEQIGGRLRQERIDGRLRKERVESRPDEGRPVKERSVEGRVKVRLDICYSRSRWRRCGRITGPDEIHSGQQKDENGRKSYDTFHVSYIVFHDTLLSSFPTG